MRISMWMIADYLEEAGYQLTVNTNEGIDEIQNIRIFSSNTKLSRYTVYLDQVDDRVICIHGHDMIYLTHNDVNQILNELLDFMELLNEWSGTADEKIRNGCSIEEL